MKYFLGIDSSTTATKALLIDEVGTVVSVGRSHYSFETPHPLWSEQSPDLWWDGAVSAIGSAFGAGGISPSDVVGIGLTGQMHGLVMLDGDGNVLRDAILWNDQRTQAECDEIRDRVGRNRLIQITGNDALTGFTAPKILWVRNHEPDVYDQTRHVLLPKDFVRLRLTGEYATDKAGGSGTILFDLAARDWSDEVVGALGIDHSWLPKTFEGSAVTGGVSAEASQATGIPAGVPVFGGAGDQAANAVGVGAVVPGLLAMSIGTSGVVFGSTDHPAVEPEGRLHAFCHAVPDMWHLMGVMLSAAGSYKWLREALAPHASFAELDQLASTVEAGSEGLIFLPYLSGERTPHPDPLARGAFVGLTVRHTLAHMARAVLEGVAFGLRDSVDLMREAGAVGEIRASGGGSSSPLWVQIISDVSGVPISVVGTSEGAAHGAAMLAAVGAGAFSDCAQAAAGAVKIDRVVEPSADQSTYEGAHGTFKSLYPALKDSFHTLAEPG
ncbi:MAG: xylulokinase [Actinomycetota bacterium]|nr:xylulokinase [Actinomycetota bacterium]